MIQPIQMVPAATDVAELIRLMTESIEYDLPPDEPPSSGFDRELVRRFYGELVAQNMPIRAATGGGEEAGR